MLSQANTSKEILSFNCLFHPISPNKATNEPSRQRAPLLDIIRALVYPWGAIALDHPQKTPLLVTEDRVAADSRNAEIVEVNKKRGVEE